MKIQKKNIFFFGGGGGVGLGGQARCEQRSEVFVKIKRNYLFIFFFGGGGSGLGGGGNVRGGHRVDVNKELKFL